MRRTFIVGNGFVHHLLELVQKDIDKVTRPNKPSDFLVTLAKELKEVSLLFSKFEDIEKEFEQILGVKKPSESVLNVIDSIMYWYRNVGIKSEYDTLYNCSNQFIQIATRIIEEKIKPIVIQFENQEINGVYGELTKWVGSYKIGDKIDSYLTNGGHQIGVFTTNYDGFLEQLTRIDGSANNGFLLNDGFAGSKTLPKTLYPPLKQERFLGHLHSSYKFGWNGEDWEKFDTSESNRNPDPLILYMNPTKKLEFIQRNWLLAAYWNHFLDWIKKSDEIVIYGNSLAFDPHIVDALKQSNSSCVIYIVDKQFDAIKNRLPKKLANREIFHIDTSKLGLAEMSCLFINPKILK